MGLSRGGASGLLEQPVNVSLYRRGRIWWVKLTHDGRTVRESAGTADKKAAQEYHEKRKGELWRQAKLGEAPPVTWGEAVAKWLALKPRGMPDRYRLRALPVRLDTTLPLSAATISSTCPAASSGSFNRVLALIVAIHNAAGVHPPKVERRPNPPGRTRWLTAEEWKRLHKFLEAESPLLAQAAAFTLETGLRENNVLELEWNQIDLQRRVAWLHGDQTKQAKPIGVPLNDAACAILASRRGTNKQYVFAHPDSGLPLYKASNRAWYTAVRKAKLKGFRWHDLRHTWASWHVMSGTRLEELQRLGGWATAQMVQRYAHLSSEHLAEAAARVKPISLRYNARKRGSASTV
jgi:integrase